MTKLFIFFSLFSFYNLFSYDYISLFNSSSSNVSVGTRPDGMATTLDGSFLYVANVSSDTVSVINLSTNTVVKTISGFDQPNSVTINPAGTLAYVTNSDILGANTVSVIDINISHKTTYNTIIATIVGFNSPYAMAITLDGKFGYVVNFASASVQRVNLTTNIIVGAPIAVGTFPSSIAMTPNGFYVYVTNYNTGVSGNDTVSVINTNSSSTSFNQVIKTISGFFGPYDLAITPNGNFVYVTNYGNFFTSKHGTTVSVIDSNSSSSTFNTIVDTITVGSQPTGITINPSGNYAFVTLYNQGNVGSLITIQLNNNTVLQPSFTLGKGPVGVMVSRNGLNLYVTNQNAGNVQFLSFINSFVVTLLNFSGSIPYFVSNMYQNAYPLLQTIGYIYFSSEFSSAQSSIYFLVSQLSASQYCNVAFSGIDCSMTPLNTRVFIDGNNGNNFYFDIPYDNLPIGPNSLTIDFNSVVNQIAAGKTQAELMSLGLVSSLTTKIVPTAQLNNATSSTTWPGTVFTISTDVIYSTAA